MSSIGDWNFGGLSVNDIQAFLDAHRAWAGPILGVAAFGESLILVGLFMPATALMFVTGGLIAAGKLDASWVIACLVVGAILGDAVTYWIGRAIGPSVVRRWPFNRDQKGIARARLFFRTYGFLSIFIGRFLGPVRSTIPLVAGMMRMGHVSFQLANVTSAIVWVPTMLALGYYPVKLGKFENLTGFGVAVMIGAILVLTVAFTGIAVLIQRRHSRQRRERRRPMPAE